MTPLRQPLRACLLAAALAFAPPAVAQEDSGAATELFNAGRDLMKAGDYKTACPKLAESARLDPKVGTLARLAECEEKIGHMVSARARWQQAVNLASSEHDDRLSHVQGELSRVDRVVPKLSFSVDGTPPADLVLKVDDLQFGVGSLGVPLPVEAGSHKLAASAAGKQPWSSTVVTLADGAVTGVRIPALADQAVVVAPPPVPMPLPLPRDSEPAVPQRESASPLRTVGIVLTGVGVVGLGVGAAFGLVASEKKNESNAQPGGCDANDVCPIAAYKLRNDARSAGDISSLFFIAGGVVAAGGLVMWIAAPKHPSSASVGVTPSVGIHTAALTLRGTF